MSDQPFISPTDTSSSPSIIKVIGVGGGGGNAVANMYRENISGVRFLVCNTDSKALQDSPVPDRLQIGPGLGVGGDPELGRKLTTENIEAVQSMLDDSTKMLFITAGMGGGTGTGAAPIFAQEAMKKGILTIGIVTIPFLFEQKVRINKALDGVDCMAQEVDALIIVNNERLREIYPDLSLLNAFRKADNTLTNAVRSILEIVHMRGISNLDFTDVDTCLRGGKVAIISSGTGSGDNRIKNAIEDALNSPLLNDRDIFRSRSLRMAIFFPPDATGNSMRVEEIEEIAKFMKQFQKDVDTKYGYAEDPSLTDTIRVTILASGFQKSFAADEENGIHHPTPEEEAMERQRERRIETIYGGKNTKTRHHRTYIFKNNDLYNEELVAQIEAMPVCKRSDGDLKRLQDISNADIPFEIIL